MDPVACGTGSGSIGSRMNTPRAELPDAWKKAFQMIEKFGLTPHGPLSPYKCGREIVHDQFDVLAMPKLPANK